MANLTLPLLGAPVTLVDINGAVISFPFTTIQGGGSSLVIDASGNLTFTGNAASNVLFTLTGGGTFTITGGPLVMGTAVAQIVGGATSLSLRNNANNADNLIITDAGAVAIRNGLQITAGNITISAGGTGTLLMGGRITRYSNVNTAGWGMPTVYSYARSATQTNTTVTIINAFAVPAADSTYQIGANVNVTAATNSAMTVTVSYTDVANVARVKTMSFQLLTGVEVQSILNANGTIDYMGTVMNVRCKASTTITIATASTVTGITYTAEAWIAQVA